MLDRPHPRKRLLTRTSLPRIRRFLPALLTLPVLSVCGQAPGYGQDPGEHLQDREAEPAPLPEGDALAALPADGGAEFNRLVFEPSLYLRQHARNPVDWYPWGPEAFEAAAREDKPVFLSVGYSTCHWCHVMEHESFEDDEVAAVLNERFIAVKVDREERPDVDQLYMSVTQALTGRGGWPMTVVMTPAREPYFAATYLPKRGRGERRGMMELLPALADAWRDDREGVEASADRIGEYLERTGALPTAAGAAPAPGELVSKGFVSLAGAYDRANGGFGSAPKFPVPHRLRFLLRYARRSGDAEAEAMVVDTLRAMRLGGVWDHVGFGWHRYSTDAVWLLPHFEKMLYDQALMTLACVEAWQATGHADLRRTAEETLAYVLRDMTSPDGGFHAAEDADSEGEEGLFYLWRPEEVVAALGQEDGAFANELFGVVSGGNFADQATGRKTGESILYLREPLGATAAARGVEPTELAARVEDVRARLFAARAPRVRPARDEKVLTDWNGLAIAAFARAGRAFDEERYIAAARAAADFVLRELRAEDGRLLKRHSRGEAGLPAVLDDYAFFVFGLIELYQAAHEPRYLAAARALAERMLVDFADEASGAFYLSQAGRADLLVRAHEFFDGALPSGNAVAALDLLLLARLTGEPLLEEHGVRALEAASRDALVRGSAHTQALIAAAFLAGPAHEVVVVGEPDSEDTRAMLAALDASFLPNTVVHLLPPTGDVRERLVRSAPWLEGLASLEGAATAYVCRDFSCEEPTTSIETMLTSLGF